MKFMDEIKICGALATWGGITLAQIDLLVKIAVGLVTIVYIIIKTVKLCRKKGEDGPL